MATETNDLHGDIKTLAAKIHGIRVAMLTTEGNDGVLRSRPMMAQETEFDGSLWFFTDEGTTKVSDLYNNRMVNLIYADPANNRYVSVSGNAKIVRNQEKAKALWSPNLSAWFPHGLEDPRVVLMKVTVTEAEYWSSSANAMVRLHSFGEALLRGERTDPSEPGESSPNPTD